MSSIRSYKGISPQIGQGVYIDTSSVLVGVFPLHTGGGAASKRARGT